MIQEYEYVLRDPEALGQIIGAIIGVTGLFVGTFLTILISLWTRRLDIRREEKKEEIYQRRDKKEKEFQIKRDIYTAFLSELAALESFITRKGDSPSEYKNFDKFDQEWTKVEIKVDLIAPENVRELKDQLQDELFELAQTRFDGKKVHLTDEYLENRTSLLEAIREEMEIN